MTSPPFSIRPAKAEDAAQVSHLIGSTWSKFFAYSVSETDLEEYLSGPLSAPRIQADILDPSMRVLVAVESSGNIVGVAHLVIGQAPTCITLPKPIGLRRLYVDSTHHGSGVAGALVQAVDTLSKKEGFESVWLGAWDQNARGLRFYEKMGWKVVGETTFMVGKSVRRDFVLERSI
ncbi:acyl-CoA N-acyltransferase [Naematelia encephala]|uniref:Acyl-CoA N-acyltransferase n=1 Tax=Naematelia encephala TaxID=71784 RepID=A0A1Y2AFU5_9TREE|nr:acyl-CoA N-acyltransferase [Naematelia encephala]